MRYKGIEHSSIDLNWIFHLKRVKMTCTRARDILAVLLIFFIFFIFVLLRSLFCLLILLLLSSILCYFCMLFFRNDFFFSFFIRIFKLWRHQYTNCVLFQFIQWHVHMHTVIPCRAHTIHTEIPCWIEHNQQNSRTVTNSSLFTKIHGVEFRQRQPLTIRQNHEIILIRISHFFFGSFCICLVELWIRVPLFGRIVAS